MFIVLSCMHMMGKHIGKTRIKDVDCHPVAFTNNLIRSISPVQYSYQRSTEIDISHLVGRTILKWCQRPSILVQSHVLVDASPVSISVVGSLF